MICFMRNHRYNDLDFSQNKFIPNASQKHFGFDTSFHAQPCSLSLVI